MKKYLILFLVTLLILRPEISVENPPIEEVCYSYWDTFNTFSEDKLKEYLKLSGIKHPDIVYQQALLETGSFTSKIFKESNNLFGMKLPKKRKTLAIGENRGHAVYSHWTLCIDDYILWQNQFKKTPIECRKDYLRLISRIYAEDTLYIKKLLNNEKKKPY